ncbi:MAG: thiamine pyrophosphate-binding protein [Betaproteobacteria bacterium]
MSGGDLVADVLARQGVRFLFTLCGGHVSPILVSAKARGIRVVDVRHEATAVFAADAVARLTGAPGVAVVTAGPGVTNVITALKNAQLAQSPLVLLGGAAATLLRGRGALQDIDQMALVRPHVKRARRANRLRDVAPLLEEAFRVAGEGVPGPVFLECPVDLLYPEALVREWYAAASGQPRGMGARLRQWYVERHLARLFGGVTEGPAAGQRAAARAPDETGVRRAAGLVARAKRPLLLVGSQALAGAAHAEALAADVRTLGLPVYLSGMARGLLGASDPLQLRHRRREALREADLVVLAGVPCDFRLDYGRQVGRRAVLVSVNLSRREARLNRRPELLVEGPPARFLAALARAVGGSRPEWRPWQDTLRARDAERDKGIASEAEAAAEGGLNPLAVCRGIDRALGERSLVVADGGDFVGTASYVVRPRGPLSWLDPGAFGTLGVGAGFALGAKLVRPDADVWIVYGDGSVGYSLAEADSFARHGLGIVAVVGNDAGWTQIAREQVELLHDDVGTVLAAADYERAAEGLGACGLRLGPGDDVDRVLAEALALARRGRPAYVNARLGRSGFRKGSISM